MRSLLVELCTSAAAADDDDDFQQTKEKVMILMNLDHSIKALAVVRIAKMNIVIIIGKKVAFQGTFQN